MQTLANRPFKLIGIDMLTDPSMSKAVPQTEGGLQSRSFVATSDEML